MKAQKYLILLFILISFGCQTKPDLTEEYKILELSNSLINDIIEDLTTEIVVYGITDPGHNEPFEETTDSIWKISSHINKVLDSLKSEILKRNKVNSNNISNHILYDEQNTVNDSIIFNLKMYKTYILSLFDEDRQSKLIVNDIDSILNLNKISNLPLNYIGLTILQNKVYNVEYLTLKYMLHNKIGVINFYPQTTETIIIAKSNIVKQNETYSAEIFNVLTDSTLKFNAFIENNNSFDTLPIVEGKAIYEKTCDGEIGLQEKYGWLEVETFGQIKKEYFKLEYYIYE